MTTDGIQIDEQAVTLDEGNEAPVASSDLQLSRPTSPQTINYIQFFNSMVAAGSNLNAPTVSSGSRNSGGKY
jgi:hypothetical protein